MILVLLIMKRIKRSIRIITDKDNSLDDIL
jgi:hypothetical protein